MPQGRLQWSAGVPKWSTGQVETGEFCFSSRYLIDVWLILAVAPWIWAVKPWRKLAAEEELALCPSRECEDGAVSGRP